MRTSKNREPSQRQLRVGEELRHALAGLLQRGELRDPALADVTVTVTEVREVREGFECGMAFENYQDIQTGDIIECFEMEEVARAL